MPKGCGGCVGCCLDLLERMMPMDVGWERVEEGVDLHLQYHPPDHISIDNWPANGGMVWSAGSHPSGQNIRGNRV